VAAAAEAAVASQLRLRNNSLDFSEQDMIGCRSPRLDCNAGWTLDTAASVIIRGGVVAESCR
jgi:hypothetical protein